MAEINYNRFLDVKLLEVHKTYLVVQIKENETAELYFVSSTGTAAKTISKSIETVIDDAVTDQAVIHLKSYTKADPISVALKGYKIINAHDLISYMKTTDARMLKWLKDNSLDLLWNYVDFGVMTYESLEGYKTVDSLIKSKKVSKKNKQLYAAMYAYALIAQVIKFSISHGNYSGSHVMINPTDTSYFRGLKGSAKLVKFDKTFYVSTTQMVVMQVLFERKHYCDMIMALNQNEQTTSEIYLFILDQPRDEFEKNVDYLFTLRDNMKKRKSKDIMDICD